MQNNNKKIGNEFEEDFCKYLYKKGFWVLNIPQSRKGQPADVIAIRQEQAFLIDCKDCKNDKFPLSRIEPNQHTSMQMWIQRVGNSPQFALKTSKGVYLLSYIFLKTFPENYTLTLSEIQRKGVKVDDYISE